ncbi:MAG: YcgN family cysteine cluster protein [Alphaproteobacteria bacterium]|nr:YcgN family cysteine cluster protein [Alphaproteobacteria bacterium]
MKKIEEYTEEEWENICSNCGKCCLIKLQDEDTDEIYYTNVVCKYFNQETCKCSVYENRCNLVPECLKLTKDNVDKIKWMPKTCAYRKLFENAPDIKSKSIKGRCVSETIINPDNIEDYIVDWDDL